MSASDHIRNYSASDIEKYWKGKLSQAEMHAMEKAAMDDPFLADAMEGYRNTDAAEDDIRLLQQQLKDRTGTKVLPLAGRKFPWLRVAAAVIIIGGSGVLASQLFFNNPKNELVATEETGKESAPATQQNQMNVPPADTIISEDNTAGSPLLFPLTKDSVAKINSNDLTTANALKTDSLDGRFIEEKTTALSVKILSAPVTLDKSKTEDYTKKENNNDDQAFLKKDVTIQKADDKANNYQTEYKQKGITSGMEANRAKKNAGTTYLFRGRTVDAQNNPIPFANITNQDDQVGTYSDAKGYFNLISPDTALNVKVRSLGYESLNYRLRNTSNPNDVANIVMQEDKDALLDEEVVIARRTVKSPSRGLGLKEYAKTETDDPEPEDGWENYDTYITNNFRNPQGNNINPNGEVELSFRIDKQGRPTDIKVLRSYCNECNDEVIRLLREGPRWKRSSRNAKTTVTISVDNN